MNALEKAKEAFESAISSLDGQGSEYTANICRKALAALDAVKPSEIKPNSQKTARVILSKCLEIFDGGMIDEIACIVSEFAEFYHQRKLAEVCEWTKTNKHDGMSQPNCCAMEHINYGFKFCPFCGKPISIKAQS